MEDLAAAMRDLALSIGAVKSTVDDSHAILREIGTCKPQVDGALQEMRSGISTLCQQLGRVALNPILGSDPSTLQVRAALVALVNSSVGLEVGNGDGGRRPGGHCAQHQIQGLSAGELSLTTPSAKASSVVERQDEAPTNSSDELETVPAISNSSSMSEAVVENLTLELTLSENLDQIRAKLEAMGRIIEPIGAQGDDVVTTAVPHEDIDLVADLQAKCLTVCLDVKALHVVDAHVLTDDTILTVPESADVDDTNGATPASKLGVSLRPITLLHETHFGPWILVVRGSVCVNAEEGLMPQLLDIVHCSNIDKNIITWPSFMSGMNLVLPSATGSLDVKFDYMCLLPAIHVEIRGSGVVQLPWSPPQISTLWLSCRGQFSGMQIELKPWPGELQHQCSSVRYSTCHATVMKLQKLSWKCSASIGVHLTRGSVCHLTFCVEGNKFRNLTCSASGTIVKHEGAPYVEHTTVSTGQESVVGKWIQLKVVGICLNVVMGTNRLIYALKYARSKADQLLVRFWHSFALPVGASLQVHCINIFSWWSPFLKLGAAIIWDCIDFAVQLSLTYRLSLVKESTVVARRGHWLVPINDDIYQLYLQIGRVELSWLESLCFCEPWRSWCLVQRFSVLAEYYATISDGVLHWEVPIIHKLCFSGVIIKSTATQVSLVLHTVARFPCNTLQLHQLFLTYSDEQVALGGDFEYYVGRDSIKKPL